MSTSFFQYLYCTLCKVSHKQRKKKHIYSQRHQITLKNVLSKFTKKVELAKSSMDQPTVRALGWESGARVWCYLCQSDIDKHQTRDDCTVVNAAFLAHLASPEHSKKMHEFFWENLVPVNKKESFVVSAEEVKGFMEKAEQAVIDYQQKEKEKLEQETKRIRAAEQHSPGGGVDGETPTGLVKSSTSSSSSLAVKAGDISNTMTSQQDSLNDNAPSLGKKTVFAFGQGLTCITTQLQNTEETVSNIYTGATPPWLMEQEDAGKGEIGPTAETFNKYLEGERKQKLPACRVGATFNHKVDTTSQWLPAFGRVWNSGRRLNSQHQFMKERFSKGSSLHSQNRKKAASMSSYNPPPSASCTVSRPEDMGDDATHLWNTCHEGGSSQGDSWSSQSSVVGGDVDRVVDSNSGQYSTHTNQHPFVSDPAGHEVVSHPGNGPQTHNTHPFHSASAHSGHHPVMEDPGGQKIVTHAVSDPYAHLHNTHLFHSVSGSYDSHQYSCNAQSEMPSSSQLCQASSASASFLHNVSQIPDRPSTQTYTDHNSHGYHNFSVNVGSLKTRTEKDLNMLDDCRPYKRRSVVQNPHTSDANVLDDCKPYKQRRVVQSAQVLDADISDDCRPYKRQRVVQNSQSLCMSGLIPITPSLLSAPAPKTQHFKQT